MKLTPTEKTILKNSLLKEGYYIHRERNGDNLFITNGKWLNTNNDPLFPPIKYREGDTIIWFGMYRHLFKGIKSGEEYSIEELMK